MNRGADWSGVKQMGRTIFDFVLALVFLLVVTIVGFSFVQNFYAPIQTYEEFLSATTVLVSILALLMTAFVSWRSASIFRDEYQPVPSLTYENLPPSNTPETIITVTNVGKRNLHISSAIVTGTWFAEEIIPGLEVKDIAPSEQVPIVVELPPPLPGLHTLRTEISDEDNDKTWKKVKVFRVMQEFDVGRKPVPPDHEGA